MKNSKITVQGARLPYSQATVNSDKSWTQSYKITLTNRSEWYRRYETRTLSWSGKITDVCSCWNTSRHSIRCLLSGSIHVKSWIHTVGCIYASEPFNSSLIYYQPLFHSNSSTIKRQKQLKYILSIFLVFLLTLFPCHLYFLHYMSYEGLSHLLLSLPFDSGSRKRLPTHWLYPTIWPPDDQGANVPGK